MDSASARELEVIDGTCSWVTQEQKELAALVEEHDCVRSVIADPVVVSPMWARVADVQIVLERRK